MTSHTIEVKKTTRLEQLTASLPEPINEKTAPAEIRALFKQISAKKLPIGSADHL